MISVILAAGAGRRLGGVAKALLRVPSGETYLERIAHTQRLAGATGCAVVVGPPFGDEVAAEVARLGVTCLVNEDAVTRGMASSVEVGFRWALAGSEKIEWALLWPVDHPLVTVDIVRKLCEAARGRHAVVPTYRGRGGHPAVVSRDLWIELSRCGDEAEGARSVFRNHASEVARVEVDEPAVVRDVDSPEDLP